MNAPRVMLVRVDDPACPEGPRQMMGDVHRVGCSNGKSCPAPRAQGGAARATHYARVSRAGANGSPEVRASYFCDRCGAAFAHRHGISTGAAR